MAQSINEIETEIADHRERLGQAVAGLKARIRTVRSPSDALEAVAPTGEGHPLVDVASAALRRHPGPLLLIGVGVLLMLMSSKRARPRATQPATIPAE